MSFRAEQHSSHRGRCAEDKKLQMNKLYTTIILVLLAALYFVFGQGQENEVTPLQEKETSLSVDTENVRYEIPVSTKGRAEILLEQYTRLVLRRKPPTRVIHCWGFSSRWVGVSRGVSIRMVRNFKMLKWVFRMPTRF